jgi:L-gulonate 5-dehydrogenase
MRAAVTSAARTMAIAEVPAPARPGEGEAIVRPETVGICGSDFHLFLGELGPLYPRIQGHEVCARVDEVGPGCGSLREGDRVAIWPVISCGECYPCSLGRGNACSRIRIVGVHTDGALQERLVLPASQLFPVGDEDPLVGALVEPVSIGVRTANRARLAAGERVVVLGAGPIGQGVTLAARDRGASVLLVDRIASRLEHGGVLGADVLDTSGGVDLVGAIREWSGAEGPPGVVDATGVAGLIEAAVAAVATAGRVVVVGISEDVVPVAVGSLVFRELDLLGVSCCSAEEFAAAVGLVERNRDLAAGLVTHEFPFEQAPEALVYAMEHPAEVLKAVIRMEE